MTEITQEKIQKITNTDWLLVDQISKLRHAMHFAAAIRIENSLIVGQSARRNLPEGNMYPETREALLGQLRNPDTLALGAFTSDNSLYAATIMRPIVKPEIRELHDLTTEEGPIRKFGNKVADIFMTPNLAMYMEFVAYQPIPARKPSIEELELLDDLLHATLETVDVDQPNTPIITTSFGNATPNIQDTLNTYGFTNYRFRPIDGPEYAQLLIREPGAATVAHPVKNS
jgi:hypothetical protein